MLTFFENVTNFFVSIWELITNTIQLIVEGIILTLSMVAFTGQLTVWVPTIIGLSISLVIGVCVLRFLLLK